MWVDQSMLVMRYVHDRKVTNKHPTLSFWSFWGVLIEIIAAYCCNMEAAELYK